MDSYESAVRGITPLQRRVLDALDGEGRPLSEIAVRAGVNRARHHGSRLICNPDLSTIRNVCGWLSVKGLAVCHDGLWHRVGEQDEVSATTGRARSRRALIGGRVPNAAVLP